MNTAAIVRIEPTDAQLRDAWRRLARRFAWIGTFEDAMEDGVRSRLVRMNALHRPAPRLVTTTPACPPPAMYHGASAPRQHTEQLPGFIDYKRRAAGERDDD
jgi:hypothetical protein